MAGLDTRRTVGSKNLTGTVYCTIPKSSQLSKNLFLILSLFLVASIAWSREMGLNEAERLYQQGEYQKAADLLASLSRSSPGDSALRLWLGNAYLKIRKWDEAVRELEQALQLAPSS